MFKPVMNKTQEDLILDHLKNTGSISGVEAFALYKVRSLPRRIATLKERNWKIDSIRMEDNCGQRYVRYVFCKNQPNIRVENRQSKQLELPL